MNRCVKFKRILTGIGLNSYVNVFDNSSWATMNKATVGGALSEATSQVGLANGPGNEVPNDTAAWFGGIYWGHLLNHPDRPYGIRGNSSVGVFMSAAGTTTNTYLARPQCRQATKKGNRKYIVL